MKRKHPGRSAEFTIKPAPRLKNYHSCRILRSSGEHKLKNHHGGRNNSCLCCGSYRRRGCCSGSRYRHGCRGNRGHSRHGRRSRNGRRCQYCWWSNSRHGRNGYCSGRRVGNSRRSNSRGWDIWCRDWTRWTCYWFSGRRPSRLDYTWHRREHVSADVRLLETSPSRFVHRTIQWHVDPRYCQTPEYHQRCHGNNEQCHITSYYIRKCVAGKV